MITLDDFLFARIEEDEAGCHPAFRETQTDEWYAERMMAESKAKRRILQYRIDEDCSDDGMVTALRALASVYVDHPDYREEWRL